MITGNIQGDRDRVDSRARLSEIIARLSANHDANVPFLLLPVRLETRFMEVDVPVKFEEVPDRFELIERLRGLLRDLRGIKERELFTSFQGADRKLIKKLEAEHYAFLDRQIRGIRTIKGPLLQDLRNSSGGTKEEAAELRKLATALDQEINRATDNVGKLRSPYQQQNYTDALQRLNEEVISPIVHSVSKITAPRFELLGDLRTVSAKDVLAELDGLRRELAPREARALLTAEEEASSRQQVSEKIELLRQVSRALVQGEEEDLEALRRAWKRLDGELHSFSKIDGAYEAADENLGRDLVAGDLRRDFQPLESQRAFRSLSNQDFKQCAIACEEILQRLASRVDALSQKALPASRRSAQTSELCEGLIQDLKRIDALGRELAILPTARREEMLDQHQALVDAFAPWAGFLERSAEHGGQTGQQAAAQLREAWQRLDRQATTFHALRTDAWTSGDRSALDGGLLIASTLPTRTVDELWVRIYPDDIHVHTHEEALTAEEVEDSKAFWQETIAAENDDELKRGAWRALAKHHGSRRAAYIAHTLKPTRQSGGFSAAGTLVKALQTLNKRILEVGNLSNRALLNDPKKHLTKIERAIQPILELRVPRATTVQLRQAVGALNQSRTGLKNLESRISRLLRPSADLKNQFRTLHRQLEKIEETLKGIKIANRPPADSLVFPRVPIKEGTWTVAPHCRTLPERFVVLTVNGGRVSHAVVGEPIKDLKIGLDPDPDDEAAEEFLLDEDGNLIVGESIRWMTNFDEAIQRGMGMRVEITAEEAEVGFDEVFVLGIKEGSPAASQELFEDLIENFRFNEEGISFLPIGTPTNNTEEKAAAYRSDDDPEKAYDLEFGDPLFDPNESRLSHTKDGQRFAAALGLNPSAVQRLEEADGLDIGHGLIMNQALWPATLGAYGEDFLGTLISMDTLARVETFFTDHVSARGFIPAFRVGSQPYGVLLTTAFNRFQSSLGTQLPALPDGGAMALPEATRARRFEILLLEFFDLMNRDWTSIREEQVKHAHGHVDGDPQQHFMDMLGLHATSVDAEYRFALNVAHRYPAPVNSGGFPVHTDQSPMGFLLHLQNFFKRAFSLGGPVLGQDGLPRETFQPLFDRIFEERVFDVRLLERAKTLRGSSIGSHPSYIPQLLQTSASNLMAAALSGVGSRRPILYLLLRQALLVRLRGAARDILKSENMLSQEAWEQAGSADEFVVRSLFSDRYVTKWSYLFGDLEELNGRFSIDFPEGAGSLFRYLTVTNNDKTLADYLVSRGENPLHNSFSGRAQHQDAMDRLRDHATRLNELRAISRESAQALLQEHLDLCSHRLDAWRLGVAHQRLETMRRQEPRGLYLGAYGWVENLRPSGERRLAEDLPQALHIPSERPIFTDEDNQGFIHAPSLTHAVTAAVLRSGYLTETDAPDLENRMAVNLSSRRVRLALAILEGIQGGQDLGSLLGYRFERELHEAYQEFGFSFDDLIFGFRRAYPAIGAVDPANLAPEQSKRMVTDGLCLLDTVHDWVEGLNLNSRRDRTLYEVLSDDGRYTGYPWGLTDQNGGRILPRLNDPDDARRLPGVLRAIDNLSDALDAVGDLTLSEGVYQIVRGNFPRAAAVMAALAQGKTLPRPQVVDTPRTGTAVTHRLLLTLEAIDGRAISSARVADDATLLANQTAALPVDWAHLPMTPRANTEPAINRWLGGLLGPPGEIVCRYFDPAREADGVQELSVEDLELQPIDLLYLIGQGLEEGEAELVARIVTHTLPANFDPTTDLADAPRPKLDIRFAERNPAWPASRKTFYEVGALLMTASETLGRSRAVDADDLMLDERVVSEGEGVQPGWDADETAARVEGALARLETLTRDLMQALNGGAIPGEDLVTLNAKTWAEASQGNFVDPAAIVAQRAAWTDLLLQTATFGVRVALPPVFFESVEAVARTLVAALSNAFVQLAKRWQEAQALVTAGGFDNHRQAAKVIFGKAFLLVPQFAPRQVPEMRDQLASNTLLRHAGPFAVDSFLQGMAAVRENPRALQQVWILGEAFGQATPTVQPVQFPHVADDYWLGAAFPEAWEPSSNKLSLLLIEPQTWDLDGAAPRVAALLVDEWTETLPSQTETTGTAFFYDQPDAAPPQSLLLVVPPKTDRWRFDDLVHTLHDTLELARNRTVEAEHLSESVWGHLLPAMVGEVVPNRVGDGSDSLEGSRVILDFGENN